MFFMILIRLFRFVRSAGTLKKYWWCVIKSDLSPPSVGSRESAPATSYFDISFVHDSELKFSINLGTTVYV